MDKKALQKKLSQPYTTQNWQEVVQFVFPNVQIFNPVQVIPVDEKHKNIVDNFNHLVSPMSFYETPVNQLYRGTRKVAHSAYFCYHRLRNARLAPAEDAVSADLSVQYC